MTEEIKRAFNCLEQNQITETIELKISSNLENFKNEIEEYNEYLKNIERNYRINQDSKLSHEIKMVNNTIETSFSIQWIPNENHGIDVY